MRDHERQRLADELLAEVHWVLVNAGMSRFDDPHLAAMWADHHVDICRRVNDYLVAHILADG